MIWLVLFITFSAIFVAGGIWLPYALPGGIKRAGEELAALVGGALSFFGVMWFLGWFFIQWLKYRKLEK